MAGGFFGRLFGGDKGFGPDELARRLGMSIDEIRAVPRTYTTHEIPKRGGGMRTIQAPNEDLKKLQRRILHRLLGRLRAHSAVTGFEKRHSIVTNALPHVGRDVVVRMDIREFFPSTSEKRVREWFRKIGWNREAAGLLTDLCTSEGGLPQGAPTSPRISNLVNFRMDARLEALARRLGASYTRYADDMTFSFDEKGEIGGLFQGRNPRTGETVDVAAKRRAGLIIRSVKNIIDDFGYSLHTRKKLSIRRRHQQQRVTGLVVNVRADLPRRVRRRLRAVEHHLAAGKPATMTEAQLRGWKGLREMILKQRGT